MLHKLSEAVTDLWENNTSCHRFDTWQQKQKLPQVGQMAAQHIAGCTDKTTYADTYKSDIQHNLSQIGHVTDIKIAI